MFAEAAAEPSFFAVPAPTVASAATIKDGNAPNGPDRRADSDRFQQVGPITDSAGPGQWSSVGPGQQGRVAACSSEAAVAHGAGDVAARRPRTCNATAPPRLACPRCCPMSPLSPPPTPPPTPPKTTMTRRRMIRWEVVQLGIVWSGSEESSAWQSAGDRDPCAKASARKHPKGPERNLIDGSRDWLSISEPLSLKRTMTRNCCHRSRQTSSTSHNS